MYSFVLHLSSGLHFFSRLKLNQQFIYCDPYKIKACLVDLKFVSLTQALAANAVFPTNGNVMTFP